MSETWTGARFSRRAALRPAKPPPTMTTCGRGLGDGDWGLGFVCLASDILSGELTFAFPSPQPLVSYSGSGLSFVSGANGSVARPTRKIAHIVMAEYRSISGEPKWPKTVVARAAEKKLPAA